MIKYLKKKIKKLTTNLIEKYSLIQLDAKEKRDKKREERRKKEEYERSFTCPFCAIRYKESQYYENQTKEEDIEIKEKYKTISINFFECPVCKKLFGVKETCYYEPSLTIIRSSFLLRDKEEKK